MFRRTLVGIGMVLALAAPLVAQEHESAAQERPRPTQQEEERAKAQEKERARAQEEERARAQERADQERRERERQMALAQPVNIGVELTIRDQRGNAQPVTKTVTMVVADRTAGRIRTAGSTRTEKFGFQGVTLNVDASPTIVREGLIRLRLTMEYRPADTEGSYSPNVSENIETLLQNGKPQVISRSADPDSDRSVTVELKATILK